MQLVSSSFVDQAFMPEQYAFGKIDAQHHVALAGNINPHLSWTPVAGAQSFVIVCHDPDVPSQPDDVNQEGRVVPADLPRVDFFHWLLVDVPGDVTEIAEGSYSSGITPRGKAGPLALDGTRQGINDYTTWFAADHDMSGDYFGYDGPCPPWNDALVHKYVFTVYALDIARLPVDGRFNGADVIKAMQGHVIEQASMTALYTLNPDLVKA